MAVVVGFQGKTFTFDDGKSVEGFYIHTEEKRQGVTGMACEATFISKEKLQGYVPVLGDEIDISYNRFGKPRGVSLIRHGG